MARRVILIGLARGVPTKPPSVEAVFGFPRHPPPCLRGIARGCLCGQVRVGFANFPAADSRVIALDRAGSIPWVYGLLGGFISSRLNLRPMAED